MVLGFSPNALGFADTNAAVSIIRSTKDCRESWFSLVLGFGVFPNALSQSRLPRASAWRKSHFRLSSTLASVAFVRRCYFAHISLRCCGILVDVAGTARLVMPDGSGHHSPQHAGGTVADMERIFYTMFGQSSMSELSISISHFYQPWLGPASFSSFMKDASRARALWCVSCSRCHWIFLLTRWTKAFLFRCFSGQGIIM